MSAFVGEGDGTDEVEVIYGAQVETSCDARYRHWRLTKRSSGSEGLEVVLNGGLMVVLNRAVAFNDGLMVVLDRAVVLNGGSISLRQQKYVCPVLRGPEAFQNRRIRGGLVMIRA